MKHHHSTITLVVVGLVVVSCVYGVYTYMKHAVSVSVERALAARETMRSEDSYRQQEQALTTIFDTTSADRIKLRSLFVHDTATVAFIEKIESLGTATGASISLTSISTDNVGTGVVGTSSARIRAHVDVQGTWGAVMRTLMLAEILPYDLAVSRLHLDTSGALDSRRGASSREWRSSFVIDAALVHE